MLRFDRDGAIAVITLARPEALNAFTREMAAEFVKLIDRADADDTVRVTIVTGEGRAFSAGADLKGSTLAKVSQERSKETFSASDRDFGGFITLRLFRALKPVIFAINGPAAGMGVTMSLAGDIRMASTGARFTLPFVRRGIVPESASAWFLPRIVGISRALEWMLSGRSVSAEEALQGGLVRSLHAPEALMPAALDLAREISENTAPVSVALTRQLLWRMLGADHPMEAHKIESRALHACKRSDDIKEGVASFLEKRAPRFTGRVSHDMPDVFPWWTERDFE